MSGTPLTIHGDVGITTGRLRHEGDVRVLGSVRPGYGVESTGDLLISGNVESAQLRSGGDLVVNGILSGPRTLLEAVGSVFLRQALDAEVRAGLDIEIRVAAERCDLSAGRRILLANPPGLIRGGTVSAGIGFEAVRVESAAGREAEVRVGIMPFAEQGPQLRDRLSFARSRFSVTQGKAASSAPAYRRRVADLSSYRTLEEALAWRLRQVEMAEAMGGTPYVRVTGGEPVQASVDLGGSALTLSNARELRTGRFVAMAEGGGVRVRPLEEGARVG